MEGAKAASNTAIKLTTAIVRRKRDMIRGYDNPLLQIDEKERASGTGLI